MFFMLNCFLNFADADNTFTVKRISDLPIFFLFLFILSLYSLSIYIVYIFVYKLYNLLISTSKRRTDNSKLVILSNLKMRNHHTIIQKGTKV